MSHNEIIKKSRTVLSRTVTVLASIVIAMLCMEGMIDERRPGVED